jgi:hypothetical protein
MLKMVALGMLILSAPGVAQPSRANAQLNSGYFISDNSFLTRQQIEESLQRAGVWGRCVVELAPEPSRTYVASKRIRRQGVLPADLRSAFSECKRQVGKFYYDRSPRVLRAALIDGLRHSSRS